jgi:hypothetical protein
MDELARLRVRDDRPDRHQHDQVLSVAAVAVAAFAVGSAPGAKFWVEAKLKKGVELVRGFEEDRAAAPAVSAGGTSARDEFFTAEGCNAVATVSALDYDSGPI